MTVGVPKTPQKFPYANASPPVSSGKKGKECVTNDCRSARIAIDCKNTKTV